MIKLVFILLVVSWVHGGLNPEENAGLFEGDLLLTPEQQHAVENGLDVDSSSNFGASTSARWTNGVVPYTFAASIEKLPGVKNMIKDAMKEWSDNTCIRFVERKTERNYVEFYIHSGCWSQLGMTGIKQKISLGALCWQHGIIVHEIGHTLGFWHEQSRPDRDNYIEIKWDNIVSSNKYNFEKYTKSKIDSLNVPYDYDSIMHYGAYAFSANGKETIVPKQNVKIGQRVGLSPKDIQQMRLMYKCQDVTTQRPTATVTTPAPDGKITVYIRSEGCNDPHWESQYKCGRAYIKVNGKDYAKKTRGHNIVVVNHRTGQVESSTSYDTHKSWDVADDMARFLNNLEKEKIVLVAIQDDGSAMLSYNAKKALKAIGAKDRYSPRGSQALLGYTSRYAPLPGFVEEVTRGSGMGPSIIRYATVPLLGWRPRYTAGKK